VATGTISVEPIREEHIEGFREALDIVSRERRYLSRFEAPSPERMRVFILDMINGGHPQFVALAGPELVGWCDIRPHDIPSHAHRGTLGMGIIPGYRGRGLGTRLITATLDAARAAGLRRIELDAHADNPGAIALYEKVGFVREGVARDAVQIDGRYIDSIGMAIIF
jgi:RimJ/RimL family protein N-acetyltransferase